MCDSLYFNISFLTAVGTKTLLQQQSNWWSHPTFQGHLTPPQTQKVVVVGGGAHVLIVFLPRQEAIVF